MSKKQKKRRQEKPQRPVASAQDSSPRRWTILAAIALAGVLLGIGMKRFTQPQSPVAPNDVAPSVATDPPAESNQPVANSATKNSVFDAILGKWIRSEGGYILDLRAVDAQGKLDAEYLNPQSIHVARAEATRPGAEIKVFVELQDLNYPGSTYDLTYDAASDRLTGVYFQAVEKQSFEVTFSRGDGPR